MKSPLLLCLVWLLSSCGPMLPPSETVRVAWGKGGSVSVKKMPLERYLLGVLQSELPAGWPLEAVKAQAVASRTYALYRKAHPRSKDYDLEASVEDQVVSRKIKKEPELMEALRETAGEILQEGGEILPAFFHSCCGGMSESGKEVWPDVSQPSLLHYRGDPFCEICPRYHWEYRTSKEELRKNLEPEFKMKELLRTVTIESRDPSGRVTSLLFQTTKAPHRMAGTRFRQLVGYTKIFSTLFDVADEGDSLLFTGKGSGHGVGLCQWGAKGMADQGKSYREILKFYYPEAQGVGKESVPEEVEEAPADEESPSPETEPTTEPTEVDPE